MLQIIGWLGCVYLLLRSIQMGYSRDLKDDDGRMREGASFTMIFGIIAAVVFAVWLGMQGSAFTEINNQAAAELGASESTIECINNARTNDEVLACTD